MAEKTFFEQAWKTVSDFGQEIGKKAGEAADQASEAFRKTTDAVSKQADDWKESIDAFVDDVRTSWNHTIVKLDDSDIEILLPDGYEKLKYKNFLEGIIKSFANEEAGFQKTVSMSDNLVLIYKTTPDKAMDPDDIQRLIDSIHDNLEPSQGLIEVRNGVTRRGFKYIYSIVKNLGGDFPGVQYYLRLDLLNGDDVVEVRADFNEIGETGLRETIGFELARRAGLVSFDTEAFAGWSEDPYDPSYVLGCRKNLSEKESLDRLFPDNPLSQARELLRAILKDELVIEDESESKKNAEEQPSNNDDYEDTAFLSGLFADECRRKVCLVDIKMDEPADKKQDATKNEDAKTLQTSLDDKLEQATTEYNALYANFSDHGTKLFFRRERALDLLGNVENLVNSIANHPKEFDAEIAEICVKKQNFHDICKFAEDELKAAKQSAFSAGAGVAGGAAVASLAPTAAVWVATTFGTASTGTAISTLSGAVATKAALAWLGGGAIAAGGGGVAAGEALLALAGPIGWSIAGATLLTSIVLFAVKKNKLNKDKEKVIESVLSNTERIRELDAKVIALLEKTDAMREGLQSQYTEALEHYGKSFRKIDRKGQALLASLVNNAKSLALSLGEEA